MSNPPHTAIASIWVQPSQQGPIKPQPIEIVPFNGNVLKWQEFWDQFGAAIHNGTFSSIGKMNYLHSLWQAEPSPKPLPEVIWQWRWELHSFL